MLVNFSVIVNILEPRVSSSDVAAGKGRARARPRGSTRRAPGTLSEPDCFSDFGDAIKSVGLSERTTAPAQLTTSQLRASYVIAVHYDGTGYSGSSLTVTSGTGQCNGGYINFRTHYTSWNNRFESLTYGCDSGPIKHWDVAPASGGSCSGSSLSAWSNKSTLGSMNNRTSCVRYG